MSTENFKESCLQRDSAEREKYAGARRSFRRIWKERDSAEPELLEAILDRRNMNKAYKRVKVKKGAPGIDGMSIEEALLYLREHKDELIGRIKRGKYTPAPVRRVEIPKADGGIRKLGIPTVIDRIIQQAISQKLLPIYEPLFSDGSYGYRPGRSAKEAIRRVKEYAEEGYRYAVSLDLSKYFDTLNHERLLETSSSYLEGKLKLAVNREKSKVTSVFAIRNFKFLGFALGRSGSGIFIRVHPKSWKKMKAKLKSLSCRRHVQSVIPALYKIRVSMRGWLNYYGIAAMKNNIEDLNGSLYHRIRMCIWKMWKRPRSKMKYLMKLGIPKYYAHMAANSRRGCWFMSATSTVNRALSKEILVRKGFYDLAEAYQQMHVNY